MGEENDRRQEGFCSFFTAATSSKKLRACEGDFDLTLNRMRVILLFRGINTEQKKGLNGNKIGTLEKILDIHFDIECGFRRSRMVLGNWSTNFVYKRRGFDFLW